METIPKPTTSVNEEIPTPITDAECYDDPSPGHWVVSADFARNLERSLAESLAMADRLADALHHATLRIADFENYIESKMGHPPITTACKAFAIKALAEWKQSRNQTLK